MINLKLSSTLTAIAEISKFLPGDKKIVIEGHTDTTPIKIKFPSNLELSAARAINTANYLTNALHIDGQKIFISGYSDTQPIMANNSKSNRAKNRRVTVMLIPKIVEDTKLEAEQKYNNN